MTKTRALASAAAVAALVAISSPAQAVTLTYQNSSDVFDGGGRGVVNPSNQGNVLAGGFRLNDGANDLIAWCLDLFDYLRNNKVYTVTSTPFDDNSLGATRIANIEKLFGVNYAGVDLNSNAQSAGFQMALWELVYETSGSFSVSSGSWSATSSTAGAVSAANGYLSNLGSAITQSYKLTFLDSLSADGDHQDLISVTPIPLPAAVWMLGLGLAALGGFGRFRRKS